MEEKSLIKGGVWIKAEYANGDYEHIALPNTVLRCGRRQLAAALGGNLLTTGFTAVVRQIAWGTGGVDLQGHRIPVPDYQTGFLGGPSNVLLTTSCEASMMGGDEPAVIFHGAVTRESQLNGNWINQVGLIMENGTYFAVSTWEGFYKDSSVSFLLNWTEWFL